MPDTFFDYPDKQIEERGAAREILRDAGFEVACLRSVADDPPDCEAMLDGQLCAVEITRLTHERTRKRN